MNQAKMLAPIGLVALALLLYAATFTVNQWEVAIKLRLGKIVDSEYEPGLHFMVPLLNNIKKFDGRIQTLDSRPQRFLTIEKKDVIVDSFAKWRITNPGQFFRSTGGDSGRTARLLSERVNTALRDEFGKRTIQEVVSEDRLELMQILTKKVDANAAELGIEVVDVRVKKIDLPPEVSESVYQRMRAERERVARDLRAKGSEAAERIRADADRQRTVILAEAYKESEELRGEGDAKAAEIYAKAFNRDPDFFSFQRSLNAYRGALGQVGDMMVLQPDSDFFRYFNEPAPGGAKVEAPVEEIPVPLPRPGPGPASSPEARIVAPEAKAAAAPVPVVAPPREPQAPPAAAPAPSSD
jgi:membrane protease subunit HflC